MRIVAILAILATPAAAEPTCMARADMVAGLAEDYGETRQTVALAQGALVEMFANVETRSWTLIITPPTMVSFIVAAGTAFEAVSAPPGDPA